MRLRCGNGRQCCIQSPDRLEDALAAHLRSLAIEPNQLSAKANVGWMLVLLGRPAAAEPYLRAAIALAKVGITRCNGSSFMI